jgi:hypothetical protein
VLDALWRRLGVADAIAAVVGGRRFATDVERVVFALVVSSLPPRSSGVSSTPDAGHPLAGGMLPPL